MTSYVTAAAAVLGAGLLARVSYLNTELTLGLSQADSVPITTAFSTTTECAYRPTTTTSLGTTFFLGFLETDLTIVAHAPATTEADFAVGSPLQATGSSGELELSTARDHDEPDHTAQPQPASYNDVSGLPRSRDHHSKLYNSHTPMRTLALSSTTSRHPGIAVETGQGAPAGRERPSEPRELDDRQRLQRTRELHAQTHVPTDSAQYVRLWETELMPRTETILSVYEGSYSITSGSGTDPGERVIELVTDSELSGQIKAQLQAMLDAVLPTEMRSRTTMSYYVERPRRWGPNPGLSSSVTQRTDHMDDSNVWRTTMPHSTT